MKDPRVSLRSRPNQSKKLKLLCSFNGTFQPRPPSGKLRYTGGETRFVLVDRNIGFSTLKTKVSELFCPNNGSTFSLQYQLPGSESIDEDTLLVLIASDDDVRCMIDEYDILESHGKPTRLWIFVCDDNEHVNGYPVNNNISVNCTETQNLNDGFGVWYVGDRKGTCVKSVNDSGCDNGYETQISRIHLFGGDKVNNSATSVAGLHYGDDSLRKMVLKKHLLAKQSAPIRSFHSGSALAVEQTEMDFTLHLVSHETKDPIFSGDSFHSGNTGISSESSSKFVSAEQLPKQSYNFNINKMPTDFHAEYELRAPLSNLNRENIVPWDANFHSAKNHFAQCSCSNQMIGSVYPMKSSYGGEKVWGSLHSGIHNHRNIGHGNARNHRTTPYYVQNHQSNLTVTGHGHNDRMVGRPWVPPGIRSSSSISKQGQALRSYLPTLWKPSSRYHDHDPVSIRKVMNSRISNQTYSLDHPYSSTENLENNGRFGVLQHGTPNPKTCHMAYHDASTGMYDQSLLPLKVTDNPSTCVRAMDAQEDLLTGPSVEEHEVPHQAPCKSFDQVPMSSESICDELKNVPYLIDLQRAVSISGFSNNLGYGNGTELECNSKLPDLQTGIKSFGNLQYSAHAIQGGTASSVDLSFCNLSSLSKEMELPANSSATSNDVSETSFKPQLPLDLMDEERLSSGQQVEKSDGVAFNYSSQNATELKKDEEQKQQIQQKPPGSLSNDDKNDIKGSHKFSKVNGGIPRGLLAFYTHLVNQELQNIKNSDLEYIKELGSGAYGTVFYGKWKGSDVVIKRIKPSCFKEGALDDDRLVADFWKEAHILDHLHHPNIVAFYGVVTDGPATNLATVTEYMVNGSLEQVLHKKDRTIDQRKRLIIAMDAAFGMEYLHEKNIVHFDLKSDNLLINMRDPQRPVCKIGDLGLSRIKQRTSVSGGVRGTIRWMAPELLNSKNMVTEKVDVYSFGIVMWELLTGEQPYANLRSEEIIAGIIKGDLRPEIPSWCHPAWKSLMERCWSSDPNSRPPFSEIAKELRAMNIK